MLGMAVWGLDFRELRPFLQLPPSPWTVQKEESHSPPPPQQTLFGKQ